MGNLRDIELRNAALEHVRQLQRRYDDLVPRWALADGFRFRGRRVSFGSFYSGIFARGNSTDRRRYAPSPRRSSPDGHRPATMRSTTRPAG